MTTKRKPRRVRRPGQGQEGNELMKNNSADQDGSQPKNWFAVHRRLLFSELWLAEPFTRGQAWVDLIGLARFYDGYILKRGIRVKIKRGQVPYAKTELAKRWQWSRGKVRRFLMDLQNSQQIDQQKNNVTTLISIINYDKYQHGEPANEPANEPASEPAESPEAPPAAEHRSPNNDLTMGNNGETTTSSCCENFYEEKSAGHQRQFTEAELLYANKAADEAEAAGKIRGSKSGYRQGILNRIAAGEVDRNEIDMLAINVEADRLAGKFRKFIKTIPGMDPAEKDELLKQLAAETYEIKMDGERIEYTADIVGNELKEINAVDDYMRFDDIRDEVKNQTGREAHLNG